MKYTTEEVIKELYNSNPEYKKYTLEEFTEVAITPLAFFKKKMKEKTLPSMRFLHLGLFQVYPGIVAKLLHYNQVRYNKGIITKETYDDFNNEMEEVHRQLSTQPYKRGKVNIIYYDEESPQASTG